MRNRSFTLLVLLVAILVATVVLTAIRAVPSLTEAQAAQTRSARTSGDSQTSGIAPTTCPDSAPWNDSDGVAQPKGGRTGSAKTLVPGLPDSALICVYNGLPEPGIRTAGFGLTGERLLSSAGSRQLAQAFNALKPFPNGSISCPSDDGTGASVYFRYAAGNDAEISVSTSGCSSSSNGYLTRLLYPPIIARVHGSMTFIQAHEATIRGRVCDSRFRPRCVIPALNHLSVELRSGRLWRAEAAVHAGRFSGQTTPGRTTVTVVHNLLSAHPVNLATVQRTLLAGSTVRVTFWVH